MSNMVIVEHADGRRYAVEPDKFAELASSDFRGFRILSYEDGRPYEGPKTAAGVVRAAQAAEREAQAEEAPSDTKASDGSKK